MKYLLFIMFSSIESFSIVYLGIMLFRYRLSIRKVLFSSIIGFILASLSLFLNLVGLRAVSPSIQMIIMCVLFYVFFKEKAIKSILVCISPYFLFALVQGIFIGLLEYYKLITQNDIAPFTPKGYMIQLVSFVIVVAISFVIRKTNEGYSFDTDGDLKGNIRKYTNLVLMLVISLSVVIFSLIFYEYTNYHVLYWFVILIIAITVCTFVILFLNLMRDKEESSK